MPITKDELKLAALRRATPFVREEMTRTLKELEKLIVKVTPWVTGELRSTIGEELVPGLDADTYHIGVLSPLGYAQRVHEMRYRTPKQIAQGTGPKFIEKPVNAFVRERRFNQAIRRGMARALRAMRR